MSRVANWPDVLAAEINAAWNKRFRWDGWSCFDFCAHMVLALTGIDHKSKFPRYRTRTEASALLAQYGGAVTLITSVLGQAKHRAFAQRGDVVVADFGRGLQPAICVGLWSMAPGYRGLQRRRTDDAVAAWDI